MTTFRSRRRRHSGDAVGSASPAPARSQSTPPPRSLAAPVRPRTPATPEILAAVAASAFTPLGLHPSLVRALLEEGYTVPTPVQTEVIPSAIAGRDVLAGAQTGTGKTAAFVLPILQRLEASASADKPKNKGIRALILTPTRELAAQIGDSFAAYGRYFDIRHTVVYGGVSQRRQEEALADAPEILIATPGRLLDLMQQGFVRLGGITHYVLDEADRMLDMGFVHDVRRVNSALPSARQTLFFSATIPSAIESLARGMLTNPVRVSITPAVTTAESVDQSVMFVSKADKRALLEHVLSGEDVKRAIVFTRTKHGANRLSEQLLRAGIESAAIHGNKSQGARERALESFRAGTTKVLVATDLAARGIDVDGITHVINFELPNVAESYVHRIGRAGRAGAVGRAISFCDNEERDLLSDIERLIRRRLPSSGELPAHVLSAPRPIDPPEAPRAPHRGSSHGGRSQGSYGQGSYGRQSSQGQSSYGQGSSGQTQNRYGGSDNASYGSAQSAGGGYGRPQGQSAQGQASPPNLGAANHSQAQGPQGQSPSREDSAARPALPQNRNRRSFSPRNARSR